jgi:hypothetical protein
LILEAIILAKPRKMTKGMKSQPMIGMKINKDPRKISTAPSPASLSGLKGLMKRL